MINGSEIIITRKPEIISFDDIHELLQKAHESNIVKGLCYGTANQSAETLEKRIHEEGVCYVALHQNKLVGVATVDFRTINTWYFSGEIAHFQMEGVHPDYKGQHILSRLTEERYDYVLSKKCKAIYLTSAEKNKIVKNMYLRKGFKKVGYFTSSEDNFYSVIYVKWIDKCPFPNIYIKLRFILKKIYVRLCWKPGKISRFKRKRL